MVQNVFNFSGLEAVLVFFVHSARPRLGMASEFVVM